MQRKAKPDTSGNILQQAGMGMSMSSTVTVLTCKCSPSNVAAVKSKQAAARRCTPANFVLFGINGARK